ncbi:MAG: uncharacterized protein KVP18_002486 [Porospora cf. gigantea A]|uniref:uncharacterized protein n=1 Tax=Porospora cf. gigantea A TaxID=2853593 RepID=UPI00355A6E0B|nr:MAG: hypothetical protein KVP18_002486 [Porospora cf. gigantea A]
MKVSPKRKHPPATLPLACLSPAGVISDLYSGSQDDWMANSDRRSPVYFGSDTLPDARRSPTPLSSVIPQTSDNLVSSDTYSRYAPSLNSFSQGSECPSHPNTNNWTRTLPPANMTRLPQATPVTNYSGPPKKDQHPRGPSFVRPAASAAQRYGNV